MRSQIILRDSQWSVIHNRLAKEYPSSVLLIRAKMKSVLGFTVRNHTEWKYDIRDDRYEPCPTIRLDFYDDAKKTMFLLKFSDMLSK